jgi:hypothetical protein
MQHRPATQEGLRLQLALAEVFRIHGIESPQVNDSGDGRSPAFRDRLPEPPKVTRLRQVNRVPVDRDSLVTVAVMNDRAQVP